MNFFKKLSNYQKAGYIYFLLILVFSIITYKERTLYIDTSYYLYKMFYFGGFNYEFTRYCDTIPQILPWLCIKLNLPLKIVLISYSVSFVLLYFLVYFIITKILKNEVAGILVILFLTIATKESFFWITNETFQGVLYSILLYAWLDKPYKFKNPKVDGILFVSIGLILILLSFFSHPVTALAVIYFIAYIIYSKNDWKNYRVYVLMLTSIFLFGIKLLFTPSDNYEGNFFSKILNNSSIVNNLIESATFFYYKQNFLSLYMLINLIFVFEVFFNILKKQFLSLFYYIASVFAFFCILLIIYSEGNATIVLEKNLLMMTLVVGLPLAVRICQTDNYKYLKYSILPLSIVVFFYNVFAAKEIYTTRIKYIDKLLSLTDKYPERKFYVNFNNLNKDIVLIPWAFSTETLFYSSLKGPEYSKSIYITNDTISLDDELKIKERSLQDPTLFLGVPFSLIWNESVFNSRYFNLKKTVYQELSFYGDNINNLSVKMSSNKTIIIDMMDFDEKKQNKDSLCFVKSPEGVNCFLLEQEFSPTFQLRVSELPIDRKIIASVDLLNLKDTNLDELFLVAQYSHNDSVYNYMNIKLKTDEQISSNKWTKLQFDYYLIQPKSDYDILKVYVWNPKRKSILMDNLVVKFEDN